MKNNLKFGIMVLVTYLGGKYWWKIFSGVHDYDNFLYKISVFKPTGIHWKYL